MNFKAQDTAAGEAIWGSLQPLGFYNPRRIKPLKALLLSIQPIIRRLQSFLQIKPSAPPLCILPPSWGVSSVPGGTVRHSVPALCGILHVLLGGCAPLLSAVAPHAVKEGEGKRSVTHPTWPPYLPHCSVFKNSPKFKYFALFSSHVSGSESEDMSCFWVWEIQSLVLFTHRPTEQSFNRY